MHKLTFLIACCLLLLMPAALLAQDDAPTACNPARPAAKIGMSALQLDSSGITRNYLLYVPKSYDPAVPTPLVLSFHGRSSNGLEQSVLSNWQKIADEDGFLVAYPTALGTPTQWDTNIPVRRNAVNKDLVFVTDLIDTLSEQFCIDAARIYANGMPNGGGMSNFLACALSDRIAAIGGVSGAYIGTERRCDPPRAVPVIAFHGTADKVVTYAGGPSEAFNYPFPSVPDWAKDWAEHNGCESTVDIPATGDASGVHYTECDDEADVILYTIEGGGHTWPGGFPLPSLGKTSTDIDATATMWDFFIAHPMPVQP